MSSEARHGPQAHDGLRALAEHPPSYPNAEHEGRGLVICAGGPRLLTCAWVCLSLLRRTLGCTLPIELWHLGPHELGPVEAALFGELEVEPVDAFDVRRRHPARILGGWELKPYAVTHSRFREVLLLDADNLPARDPATLFDAPQYADTGALFWPDLVRLSADNALWDLCGVAYRNEPAWETGQAVIDKSRCWPALALTLHMNMHSDLFYEHSHGDKDTFHLAWLMSAQPYAMTRHPPRATPLGLVQRDFDGAMLFQHRNEAKWILRGENPYNEDFRFEEQCHAYLEELRGRWTGRVQALPPRASEEHEHEHELARIGWFRYEQVGHATRSLELRSGHRVGVGRGADELHWHVADGSLVLAGIRGTTCRLRRCDDGAWHGRWLLAPFHEVELTEQEPVELGFAPTLVQRLLEGVAAGELQAGEIVIALASFARVEDLTDALQRARGRWQDKPAILALLDRVDERVGLPNPSLYLHGIPAGQRYEGPS